MKKITPKELKNLLDKNSPLQLIDVRNPNEYSNGHIKNSINIPLPTLEMEIENGDISKEAPVIVYCHSGARASSAAAILQQLGFKDIYNLGGIISWPYDLER